MSVDFKNLHQVIPVFPEACLFKQTKINCPALTMTLKQYGTTQPNMDFYSNSAQDENIVKSCLERFIGFKRLEKES